MGNHWADSGKSISPWSSTGENSWRLMKTLIVLVLLSGRKIAVGSPYTGILMLKKIRSCKSFGGPVKLGFYMWLPVLQSCPKVQKFSGCLTEPWYFITLLSDSYRTYFQSIIYITKKPTKFGSQNFGYQICFCSRLFRACTVTMPWQQSIHTPYFLGPVSLRLKMS